MNAVQVDQKSYEKPPKERISIAHFLTVADVERSGRHYEKVFVARILTMGDGNASPVPSAGEHLDDSGPWRRADPG